MYSDYNHRQVMDLITEIEHTIFTKCYGYYIKVKTFNYMPEIDILSNSS